MKKISLLKSLALLGAVGLTSVCVAETALLIHKNSNPQVGDAIDLSTYNNYILAVNIEYDDAPSNEEIRNLLKKEGIQLNSETPIKFTNIEDLLVTVNGADKTFSVSTCNNSPDYVEGSSAIMHYVTPTKTNISSIIGNNPIVYLDDRFEDETLTKKNILNSLQSSYPALNINQLNVTWNDVYSKTGTATISVKNGSPLYTGNGVGVTYNTSGSVSMALDKNVITQNQTATPTFKYHGNVVTGDGLTYSCSAPSANFSFSTTTGVLTYTNGNTADFFGGAYSINASYTTGGNTYTASQIVFAQSNIQYGTLTVSQPNIRIGTLNSGTATFKVNGATISSNLVYTMSPTLPTGQGLTWNATLGRITWNGTTNTTGGIYTITGTYSGTGIKTTVASTQVYVSQSSIVETMPATGYDAKWAVSGRPHKIGKVAQLDYVTISAVSTIVYSTAYVFITDDAYKPVYDVTLRGQYDTGSGWRDLGLIIYNAWGELMFYGEHVPAANVTFRICGTWFVN